MYDFTKQTSLYLFETKVSHQSAVSISHHTILYLKQAIWIPVATFFFPPNSSGMDLKYKAWLYKAKELRHPQIQNEWVKISVLETICTTLVGDNGFPLWVFDHYMKKKIKTFFILPVEKSAVTITLSRPWIMCSQNKVGWLTQCIFNTEHEDQNKMTIQFKTSLWKF